MGQDFYEIRDVVLEAILSRLTLMEQACFYWYVCQLDDIDFESWGFKP